MFERWEIGELPEMCIMLNRYGFVIERLLMSREQEFISLISDLEKRQRIYIFFYFRTFSFQNPEIYSFNSRLEFLHGIARIEHNLYSHPKCAHIKISILAM